MAAPSQRLRPVSCRLRGVEHEIGKEGGKRVDRAAAKHPHLFLSLCTVWNNIPFIPSSLLSVKRSGPLIVMVITKPQESLPTKTTCFAAPVFSGPGATRSTVNNKHGRTLGAFFYLIHFSAVYTHYDRYSVSL